MTLLGQFYKNDFIRVILLSQFYRGDFTGGILLHQLYFLKAATTDYGLSLAKKGELLPYVNKVNIT
jgi:hypothetical protein